MRTRNSNLWSPGVRMFVEDFVAITADGARWLVEHGVRLVGVDYLSVAPFADPVAHDQILLGAGIIVLEGVNLAGIQPASISSAVCRSRSRAPTAHRPGRC